MRIKWRCVVAAWLALVLLVVSGCGNAASAPAPIEPENLVTITSDGETTIPYIRFSWDRSMTENGWASADAIQLVCELPDIAPKLPVVRYNDDFAVQYAQGVAHSYMLVYDDGFVQLDHVAPYDGIDYLTCLKQLPEGSYYVGIAVAQQGDYIESANDYAYSGTDCVFMLIKP